ncbi:hypothetical protein G0U57_018161, partial [Chelydra serpentina]
SASAATWRDSSTPTDQLWSYTWTTFWWGHCDQEALREDDPPTTLRC